MQAFHTKEVLTLGQGRHLQIKLKLTFQGFIDAMNSKNAGEAWVFAIWFFLTHPRVLALQLHYALIIIIMHW